MRTSTQIEYTSRRAFAESVYKVYGKKIFLLAYRILNNNEETEDCVQEVMRRIVANPDAFMSVPESCLGSLIAKCTSNVAVDIYRKIKRRRAHEVPFSPTGGSSIADPNEENSPAEEIIIKENRSRLESLIEELDKKQRDVIIMKYKFRMKNSAIAAVLGVSESVVNMRLHRAKKMLLKTKEDELYDIQK